MSRAEDTKQQFDGPGNQRREVVKSWTMIILRDRTGRLLANQPDQKIPIDAFVVMQRYEIQIVQAKTGGDQEDSNDADSPGMSPE